MSESGSKVYLCDEVRAVQRLRPDLLCDEFRQLPVRDQLDLQAKRILEAHQSGNATAVTHITCWHPEWVGHTAAEIMAADFTEMYGGGSTTLALLISSSHPADAGLMDDAVKVLLEAGAQTDGS
jgi:hypothetical protein